jgi:putative oxidoreductase
MGPFRLLARTTIGQLFGHGTQKLFGWFGGGGPEGTAGFFEQLRLVGAPLRLGRRYRRSRRLSSLRPRRRHALGAREPLAKDGTRPCSASLERQAASCCLLA